MHQSLSTLSCSAELSALHALAATRSVWTIDLAVLLRRFGVAVTLVTLTPGVHPGYARHAFYAGQLEEDASRVERLFGQASGLGVRVVTRSLSAPQLRAAALSGRYLVVALVDSHLLRHRRTAENADATPAQLSSSSSYGGHYVVLCGFDAGSYVVQDPASAEGPRRVPEAALDEARRAFGTDEDLLFIACV